MTRAFALAAWHRLSSKPANTWDQVAKFGRFTKDDGEGPQLAVFDLEHLGQFMDNFARQVNPLWADANHDFGEALAYYDALALVVDGVPIRTVTRRSVEQALPPLDPETLRNADTGQVEDGLYAHRYELTELGQKKLPNLSYVSPLFLTSGQDEQGNDIGYVLLNVAWTNGPFLDSMLPLKMMRVPSRVFQPAFKGAVTMNEWMKRYGIDDKATPEQMSAAMAKYAEEVDVDKKRNEESMARYRRFADAVGGDEAFGKFVEKFMKDEESMSRFRKFMDGDADDDEDDKREMTAMAKDLGVAASMSAIRQKVTELRFTTAPKTEVADLRRKLVELESKEQARAAAEKEAEVMAFARKWADASSPDCAWDPEQANALAEFYRSAANTAKLHVEKNKGRWAALGRFTAAGAPIGKPEGEPLNLAGDDPAEIEKRIDEAAKKIATDDKVPYAVAMTRVKAKHPELYAAYAAMR